MNAEALKRSLATGRWIPFVLFAAACTSSEPSEPPPAQPPAQRVAWWYEDSDLGPLTEALPTLADHEVELYVALHVDEVDWDVLRTFVLEAEAHDIPVGAWPLLLPDDGYFAGVRTAEPFAAWSLEILDQLEGLPVQSLVVDLEPELEVLLQLQSTTDLGALADLLVTRYDPVIFEEGTATLDALAQEARDRGYSVRASTLSMVLDDPIDGDDDVQRLFDVPVQAISWDEVTFQLYRSGFEDVLGLKDPISPYIVYDYALTAREHWGDSAGLDLGVIGHPTYEASFLEEDVSAALAAGIERDHLNVYSIQAALAEPDPMPWVEAVDAAEAKIPAEDAVALMVRALVQFVDADVNL